MTLLGHRLLQAAAGAEALVGVLRRPTSLPRALSEETRKAALRGGALILQPLAINQPHPPNPELLNLNTVVGDLGARLRGMIGRDFDLVRDLTPSLRPVRVDRQHVELVLATLVLNARDRLAPGGCITIETMNTVLPIPLAHKHGTLPPGRYVRVAVRDNGAVPDDATQASWFVAVADPAPASPTHPGMVYVHHLVRQNGGHLAVKSKAGHRNAVMVYWGQVEGE